MKCFAETPNKKNKITMVRNFQILLCSLILECNVVI